MLSDPIVALATPPGRSALAVVRLSGTGAFEVARKVVGGFRVEPPRTARLASFRDPSGETIDGVAASIGTVETAEDGTSSLPVDVTMSGAATVADGLPVDVEVTTVAADDVLAVGVRAVDDEDPGVDTDLVGRQAHAVGLGHAREHVEQQPAQALVEHGHRRARPVQHGVAAVGDDRPGDAVVTAGQAHERRF